MTPQSGGRRRRMLLFDPRVLFGLGITVLALWFSFRGVSFSGMGEAIAKADLALLIIPSAVAHVWSVYIRSLRWRYLTGSVATISRGPLFRATAVGFMANNIFPLRMGEVIRAWYLARESAASTPALLGTLIIERLIDVVFVMLLAVVVLSAQGAEVTGLDPRAVLVPVAAVVSLVLVFVAGLRVAPERAVGLVLRVTRPVLPERFEARVEHLLSQVVVGVGGLRGKGAFTWVMFHSAVLWLVCLPIPFIAAMRALEIELGSPGMDMLGAFTIMVWVGAAVALPSAPGFFGPYHAACWVALRPFGVPKEAAVALGTLAHATFWVTITGLGLLVLRVRGERLSAASPDSAPPAVSSE